MSIPPRSARQSLHRTLRFVSPGNGLVHSEQPSRLHINNPMLSKTILFLSASDIAFGELEQLDAAALALPEAGSNLVKIEERSPGRKTQAPLLPPISMLIQMCTLCSVTPMCNGVRAHVCEVTSDLANWIRAHQPEFCFAPRSLSSALRASHSPNNTHAQWPDGDPLHTVVITW
jgi:hypothetical protein